MNNPAPVLERVIDPSEALLWSGHPPQGFRLQASDLYLIPFSLMWAGFAFFWETTVLVGHAPLFFALWGVPFVLVGLYVLIGRFFLDAWQRERTYYGITNDRIVIVSGLLSTTTTSLNLRTVHDVILREKPNGTGTILFGSEPPFAWWYSGIWPGLGKHLPPRFEMIPDVRSVYQIIQRAQREA